MTISPTKTLVFLNTILDDLRVKVQKIRKMEEDKKRLQKIAEEQKEKGDRYLESQIDAGRLTFDHQGNMLHIKKVNTENFKSKLSHQELLSYDLGEENKKKLNVRRNNQKVSQQEEEAKKGNFHIK
jgi:hypothetical protein